MYNEGISKEGDLLELGVKMGIIGKAGSWFDYGEIKLGQGKESVKAFLKEDKKLAKEIEKKILAAEKV